MDIRNVIKSRKLRDALMYGLRFLPDSIYVSLFYWATIGKWPNLKNPKGFNEKLQWLKIHERHWEYTELADKLAVRKHVEKIIGPGHTFPLLHVWDRGNEIDFDILPNEFVLKCNHDSGSVKIINDKHALTYKEKREIQDYYDQRLKRNFFYAGREYPYKNIKPKVFAETLMHSYNEDGGIRDYKFFCFDGEPKLLLMVSGRQKEKHEDYFDMDFNRLNMWALSTKSPHCPEKPKCFEEMKEFAARMTQGIKHVRIDFYEIDGQVYFGEYTFFSGGGFEPFKPVEWEDRLGDWIRLGD